MDDIYVIGSEEFKGELDKEGINVVQDHTAEHLVVGYDSEINYNKIDTALSILLKGGKFIVCNMDSKFPVECGFKAGTGPIVKAIEYASKRIPDIIIGKPETYVLESICRKYKVNNREILMVGDSYESDILMAIKFKCFSIKIGESLTDTNKYVLECKDLKKFLGVLKNE